MKKGFSLLIVMLFVSIALLASAYAARMVILNGQSQKNDLYRLKALYAAEGGIEWAKAKIGSDPSWFTDLAHAPADDIAWLLGAAKGNLLSIGDVSCKIVREDGRGIIYSIGFAGKDISSCVSLSILKVQFSGSPPVQILWKEL